jgi:hypothetical protein
MVSEKALMKIRKQSPLTGRPVRLVLFTADTGCPSCPMMVELCRSLKTQLRNIALEIYDKTMDRDKSELYGIRLAPALVIQDAEGKYATFYGMTEDVYLDILLNTVRAVSEAKAWFSENVVRALSHLTNDVSVRVFLDRECEACIPVAETAIGLSLTSGLISSSLIAGREFPELVTRYHVAQWPTTIFGENMRADGVAGESEFLEMVFQAEGVRPGPDKKCMVCGSPSTDVICTNCKTKIQSEAVERKLRAERPKQRESA